MPDLTTEPKLVAEHPSGWLDHIRTAIFALQLASELTRDEAKIAAVHEEIERLQGLLDEHARRREAAVSTTLARTSQAEVRDRMAGFAIEDSGYREQLLALAECRGGVYADAVEEMNRRTAGEKALNADAS